MEGTMDESIKNKLIKAFDRAPVKERMVGSLDLGGLAGGGSVADSSGYGRNGCSSLPSPELPFELAFAA
jgi:hypothetical protein